MKKRHYFFNIVLVFMALFCASPTMQAQSISSSGTCSDEISLPIAIKAAPSFRMDLRTGDVNGDGTVSIADVTALIDVLLKGQTNLVPSGDVNSDGSVSIADVTALIDALLNGSANNYDVASALAALNEIYQSMRTAGWSTQGASMHQCFGISAYNLAAEVMGDDMIMGAQGSGWFWFDAAYNVKIRYTSNGWRSADLWNAYYTWISNANYLLAATNGQTGDGFNYVRGQAYAIRAYSYFMLAQWFARTYKGHENEPCVPLFTGTVFTGSTGKARSTVAQVYAQIDADINEAVTLLQGTTQQVPDHIGYAVALGLKARIALVKEDWDTAYEAANQAKNASGKTIQEVSAFEGLNDATAANVMWGARIPEDEVGMYASFWAHMDHSKAYAQRSPKLISPWLYDKMSSTDARRAWWRANDTGNGPEGNISQKFTVKDGTEWDGDYIYMRVEEMYLIAAEAACRRNQTTRAKANLTSLMQKRDPNYTCTKTGNSLGALTNDETGSLLEEILIQRRLELWGEDGRIMTIRRLRQGFGRPAEYGWPTAIRLQGKALYNPESYAWVLTIPQAEFTDNANLNPDFIPVGDQNPLGDCTGTAQNLSFETASSSMTTARTDFYYDVTVTRESTEGEYVTSVTLNTNHGECLSTTKYNVTFLDGHSTATVQVACNPLTLGQTYTGTLTLSPYDEACHTGGAHISTHAFTINCRNSDPAGQKISFERPSYTCYVNNDFLSVPITLTREVSDQEYTATIIMSENQSNVVLSSTQVYFAQGVSTATTRVYFNDIESGQTYGCVLSLSPQDISSGGEITSTQITVIRESWSNLGWGSYVSGLFGGAEFDVYMYHINGTNEYKMANLFADYYDILFSIEDNKVYIQPQQCYYTSQYGVIWMKGYANEDNSSYAGTYDPNTKTASLKIRYYCDAGYWPTLDDTLKMP